MGLVFGRAGIYVLLVGLQIFLIAYLLNSIKLDSSVIYASSLFLSFVCLIIILNMKVNPYEKLSWAILIAVVPLAGISLFLLAYFDLGHKYEKKKIFQIEKDSKDLLSIDMNLMRRLNKEDKEFYNIASYMINQGNFPTYDNTKAKYFSVGEDFFADLLDSIKKAKKFIFIEYFIIERGYMWGSLLEELVKKVNEGVEVRLMYDGSNAIIRLPQNFPKQMQELGIKCKVFSPIYPILSTYFNNRDHRKICVIDGKIAYTGGVNIADEYINVHERFGHWKDSAVKVEGMAVESFSLMFLQMWHYDDGKKDFDKYLDIYPINEGGYSIAFGDNPLREEKYAKTLYMHLLDTAKDYVYIMTPYLILDNEMTRSLKFAAERGIDVRIILPAIADKKIPYLLAKTHYQVLLEAGVKIYEYSPGFIHSKNWISDDKSVIVGSINLDYRALSLNYECGIYFYKNTVYKSVYEDFQVSFDISKEITIKDVKKYPLYKKVCGALLKPLAPLL